MKDSLDSNVRYPYLTMNLVAQDGHASPIRVTPNRADETEAFPRSGANERSRGS